MDRPPASRRRRAWGLAALLVAAAACGGGEEAGGTSAGAPSAGSAPAPPARTTVTIDGVPPVVAEVADDPDERRRGLMGREDVPDGTGMLFLFEEAAPRSFWMKDTLVPLDIAWIRDGHVVGVTTMPPCGSGTPQCPSYPSPGPVDAALEVPAGALDAAEPGAAVTVGDGAPGSA